MKKKLIQILKNGVIIMLVASYSISMLPFENKAIPWMLLGLALIGYLLNEFMKSTFYDHIYGLFKFPSEEYLSKSAKKVLSSLKTISFTFLVLTIGVSASTIFIKMDLSFMQNEGFDMMFFYMTIVTIILYIFMSLYY